MSRRYSSASALRGAIETWLASEAAETGRNLQWLRRRLVFTRMFAQLVVSAPDGWVLKGGMAVELRRPGLARATREIDLSAEPSLTGSTARTRLAFVADHDEHSLPAEAVELWCDEGGKVSGAVDHRG